MSKLDCGSDETSHPLFQFLASEATGGPITWNFAKFLCDKDGMVVKRYAPPVNPLSFEQDILALL